MTQDPLVGRTVDGRYQVTERVAQGGMAVVYRAHDSESGRDVALKVMHPHLAEGDQAADFIKRFRREARAAAGLSHPGVVAVHGQGADGTLNYLIMEYVPGTNLRQLVREGSLTVRRTFALLDQVLSALSAAHDQHVMHRDIKPENVLMTQDRRTAKLADFGLARAVTEATQTATGTVFGTVAYMAPEVITTGRSDVRADVYAIGVMAFEMLTGRQPFQGETPIAVAYAHVNATIPSLRATVGGLGDAVELMVNTFAANDPGHRPANGREALKLLRATWKALPREVLDRTPGELGAPAPAQPIPVAGVIDAGGRQLATNIPVTLLPSLGKPGARPANDDVPTQAMSTRPAPPRKRRSGALTTAIVLVLLLLLGAAWMSENNAFDDLPMLDGGTAGADAVRDDDAGPGGPSALGA
ncbi:hypothetical protein GCM10009751_25510 [Myceligenerans crystallogenes]|uniref:Protein kinase domain-containing protein n=1 Tax=Myceligenerans crystallogenes TaxID=316335 RepID=A0ABN2NG02_9MICO